MDAIYLPEAIAVGAALLAGVGAGCFAGHAEAAAAVSAPTRAWEPDPARAAVYAAVFDDVYARLPTALHGLSHSIEAVRGSAPAAPTNS